MGSDLDKMSLSELEALVSDLMAQEADIRQRKKAAQAVLGTRERTKTLARQIDLMSDEDKAALAQALMSSSIESGESFGKM